jgi:predicted RNA binding protein YcfA (HicA-like mRNA interferase family)
MPGMKRLFGEKNGNEKGGKMDSKEIISILKQDGWILKSVKGDHHHYIHPGKSSKVTVPHPAKDLKTGTVKNIFRQAQIVKK